MPSFANLSTDQSNGYAPQSGPGSLLELALPNMSRSNLLVISGTLGSGKTTVQNALARTLAASNIPTHYIQNDAGRGTTDGDLLSTIPVQDLSVLSSGCVGCRDASGLREEIVRLQEQGVRNILVETSGMADLRKVQESLNGLSVEPTIFLTLNVKHFDVNLKLGRLAGQVENASVVLLTWWQNGEDREFDFSDPRAVEALAYIAQTNPKALVCPIGTDGLPVIDAFHIDGTEYPATIGSHTLQPQKPFIASLLPRPGVHPEAFIDALFEAAEGNLIARAKGLIDGQIFHIVMNEVTFREDEKTSNDSSYVNVVTFGGPLNNEFLQHVSIIESLNKDQEITVSIPKIAEMVRDELSQAPKNVVRADGRLQTDFDFDALHRLFMPEGKTIDGFPIDLVRRYFHTAIGLRWEAATKLIEGVFDNDPDKPRYMVRVGSMLSWYQSDHAAQLERFGIAEQLEGLNPTLMMFEGLRGANDIDHLHHFTDGWGTWIEGRISFLRARCGDRFNLLVHEALRNAAAISKDERYSNLAKQ